MTLVEVLKTTHLSSCYPARRTETAMRQSDENGYAVWQAAHKGDRTGLTRLVELGMDVNARDEVSTTQRLV